MRRVGIAAAVGCFAALAPRPAFAQAKKGKGEPEDEKGYTLPYFFSIIGVLAMLVAVGMPCSRKWDVEKEEEASAA